MTLKIQNGDYVTDGCGGLERVEGTQALLQRVLFRLKAHRGQSPSWKRWEAAYGSWDRFPAGSGRRLRNSMWQKRWRKSRGCRWSV